MTRRSVSLPVALERNVRLLQANLLTTLDRDISFTQALNAALAAAFAVPGLPQQIDRARWRELVSEANAEDGGSLADVGETIFEAIAGVATPGQMRPAPAEPPALTKSYASSEQAPPTSNAPERAVEKAGLGPTHQREPSLEPAGVARSPLPSSIEETQPSVVPSVAIDPSTWGERAERIREARTEIRRLMSPVKDEAQGEREQTTHMPPSRQPSEPPTREEPFAAASAATRPMPSATGSQSPHPPTAPSLTTPRPAQQSKPEPNVERERTADRPHREASAEQQPRVMTSADLEKLRQAILGAESSAVDRPASTEPPPVSRRPSQPSPVRERAMPSADAEPRDPYPRATQRGWEMTPPKFGPLPTANPDYPGIDPSQWETVEETKKLPSKALSYEEISQALGDAADTWTREMRGR